jgi:hypothetical protein
MAIQILRGERRQQEKRVGRYMQEIRDIVQAGFDRREFLNPGVSKAKHRRAVDAEIRRSKHLNLLAYGIEPLERWGRCPALTDPKWIVRYLAWLDPKGERPTGWWPEGHGIPGMENAVRG